MEEKWIVLVEGREYGPVDLETLREWQAEGRLIGTNQIRREGEIGWSNASDVEDLYPKISVADSLVRPRSFAEIISEALRIFGKGFPQFFAFGLFVGLPSLLIKLSLAYINLTPNAGAVRTNWIAGSAAVVGIIWLFASWPIFLGALQFGAADLAHGKKITVRDLFARARLLYRRLATLSAVVYGTFLFWTAVPVLAILSLLGGEPSIPIALLAFALLGFQVYMAGRLFVNFMFWQQTATLGDLDGVEALRESRELARSRPAAPRLQRPLHRGALLASLWLLLLLVVSMGAEMPFVIARLQGMTDPEQALALMQNIMNAPAPDAMTLAGYVLTTLVHAALRPLLAIGFIVLYFDAKAQ